MLAYQHCLNQNKCQMEFQRLTWDPSSLFQEASGPH
jgi:hypothetical protein